MAQQIRKTGKWLSEVVLTGTLMVALATQAAAANKACELLTASELQTALGATVTLKGDGAPGAAGLELCRGETPTAVVLLRLATGLNPGRDRSGATERAGIEAAKKRGAQVDVKIFGPITCSTIVPPANLAQYGFNTTCAVTKPTAVAAIEVTAKSQKDMVAIDKLRVLAEKMAGRF